MLAILRLADSAPFAQRVNNLPDNHLFLIDPYVPHVPAGRGLDNTLPPNQPTGMSAEIANPDGLRGIKGSQGRAIVHVHGGCVGSARIVASQPA